MSKKASNPKLATKRFAEAALPTGVGDFRMRLYRTGDEEALAIYKNLSGEPVLARVHSECLTGEVLGSLRCDCRAQLELALQRIADEGGILIYLRQEGRGIGLANKVRAYALQDEGRDTVDANIELGFDADLRDYGVAVEILRDFGVSRVRLMTNNPDKIAQLEAAGIEVAAEAHWALSEKHSHEYIETKRQRLGHLGVPAGKKIHDE